MVFIFLWTTKDRETGKHKLFAAIIVSLELFHNSIIYLMLQNSTACPNDHKRTNEETLLDGRWRGSYSQLH